MSKVGRNAKCPCGSGKKFKNCCLGGARKAEPRRESATVTMPANIPGTTFNFVLCHRWKDPNDPRNQASPAGSPGFYRAAVVFGRSGGTLAGDLQPEGTGDSFVVLPHTGTAPNPELRCAGAEYRSGDEVIHFDFYMNIQGRLARMVAPKVQATTFADAETKTLRAINGLLSQLAVRFGVPIHVAKTEIMELATGNQRLALVMPYDNARFSSELTLTPSRDFKFYASLYREALNSNSPVYKFLCFYKIAEGLGTRRGRIAVECKNRGEEARRLLEVIPAKASERKAWLTNLFDIRSDWGEDDDNSVVPREVAGKKFKWVIDTHLRPMRIRIAHAVLDTGEVTLMADEILHIGRVYHWLGLTQCIARQMLKNDFPEEFKNPTLPATTKS